MIIRYQKDDSKFITWSLVCTNFTSAFRNFCDRKFCNKCFFQKLVRKDKNFQAFHLKKFDIEFQTKAGQFLILIDER